VPEDNKRNLLFFEAPSMRELHTLLSNWQEGNRKRFLSVSILQDGGMFCCIALTNPTEVIICDGSAENQASVLQNALSVLPR
jgi:hypothetical protein